MTEEGVELFDDCRGFKNLNTLLLSAGLFAEDWLLLLLLIELLLFNIFKGGKPMGKKFCLWFAVVVVLVALVLLVDEVGCGNFVSLFVRGDGDEIWGEPILLLLLLVIFVVDTEVVEFDGIFGKGNEFIEDNGGNSIGEETEELLLLLVVVVVEVLLVVVGGDRIFEFCW